MQERWVTPQIRLLPILILHCARQGINGRLSWMMIIFLFQNQLKRWLLQSMQGLQMTV